MFIVPRLAILLIFISTGAFAASAVDMELISSPEVALAEARKLADDNQPRAAINLLRTASERFPSDARLAIGYARHLVDDEQYGEARSVLIRVSRERTLPDADQLLTQIDSYYDKVTRNKKMAVIVIQKNLDAGNYTTAADISERAIQHFPNQDDLFQLKGEALYKANRLGEAETALRRALQLNPLNAVAKGYVEEIRTTEQAQTSTEWAEWIAIAKDKTGDFVVMFLALFAAFLTNSLISPIVLRVKLNLARRSLDKGDYDQFTDLIEGLLDKEDFAPLRSNFRYLLNHTSYEEARDILNKYVNTLDRLPTLLRILERENEKLQEAE